MVGEKLEAPLVVEGKMNPEVKWTRLLLITGLASTIGSAVPAGYGTGVMNSLHLYIKEWCRHTLIERYNWNLSKDAMEILWASIVSIFLVGGAIGSLTGAGIANRFGRKMGFLICCKLYMLGALCFLCCRLAKSVELLLIGRFIIGLGSGLTTAVLPMYLSEIAPLELRGTLAVFCPIGLTAGVVIGQVFSLHNVFGSPSLWHHALSIYLIFVVVCYVPFIIYPESPKWLIVIRRDNEKGEKHLKRLRGDVSAAYLKGEIQQIESELKSGGEKSFSFKDVLSDGKLMLPMVLVCVYLGGQQLTGINAIFYYSTTIFMKAGLSARNAEWANLGAGCLNLLVAFLGPVLMSKFNRRPLMLFSSFFCFLSLLAFAIMLQFIESVGFFANGCITCIFLYILFFQFGIGPIPFFIGAELFEVGPRPVAMSIGSLSSWSGNFLVGMAFPSLQNAWGALVFIPFAITCIIIFVLTKFYLPETRGRDPSEVAPLMANGFKSKVC